VARQQSITEAGAQRGPWWRRGALMRGFERLPPRAQRLVDAELQRADILGAWVVLGVAAFLGALYLVAPKALDDMSGIEPVPIVVGLFVLLSLIRLRMAYRAPLTRTAQVIFIITDFALLYGLIWSFHLEYGQPAAFYLKAPTFLFVFLLIAVRALRFEPLAVVLSGVTAAVGWAVMAAYALAYTPAPALTRQFIVYMTGNLVLVGAEVEKIVAILLVTAVLAMAIVRGRRQLVLAAAETTARVDLARFFAPQIAERITSEDELLKPGFGEIRRGAILICDIRNFTGFAARRPAREVIGVLVDYQRRMSRVIAAHGGVIDKFLGDGILATFGCALPSPTPAGDAVRALIALLAEADAFARAAAEAGREPLAVGFAVTAGDVLCGTVGEDSRLEFTVIGDPVNRAAKLEKANKLLSTAALVEMDVIETARQQGFTPPAEPPCEHFEVDVAGLSKPCAVAGWRRPAASA
jgi:adenylate cyclase